MRLGGEVDHRLTAIERLLDGRAIGNVALDEAVARVRRNRLEVGQVAGVGQLVEDRDFVLGVPHQQALADELRADEPGAASDQDAHQTATTLAAVSTALAGATLGVAAGSRLAPCART